METFGKAYVIDHCVGFFQRRQEEQKYRIYITDALKAITDNTVRMYGGVSLKMRYADMIDTTPQKEETRTAEEVIDHIKEKMQKLTGG